MREVPIVIPEFGKPKPYLVNLPNANGNDLATQFVLFCADRGLKMAAVVLEAIREYMANHKDVY